MSCGMKTWNRFDRICSWIYAKYITNKWHMEYLVEEQQRKQLIDQWEEYKYK